MRSKIIPIFIPHLGCPHHCIYCDQKKITGIEYEISEEKIREIIDTYHSHIFHHHPSISKDDIQIAFYGGNFTGLDLSLQEALLEILKKYVEKGMIGGVRISTRPDFLNQEQLSFLKKRHVRTIEIGVQSLDEEVLARSGRDYSPEDVFESIRRLHSNGFQVGVQIMLGLPGDTFEKAKTTVKKIIDLRPDFVRLYPTLVIKDTPLERLYAKGEYRPFSLDDVIKLCKTILLNLEMNRIPVIRLGLHPSVCSLDKFVDGPFHPSLKHIVKSEISFDLLSLAFEKYKDRDCSPVVFYVPEKNLSEFKGFKRKNILRIKERFHVDAIGFVEKKGVTQGSLIARFDKRDIAISYKDLMYQDSYQL